MILDTNAISALFAGDEALERLLHSRAKHELPVIVIGEYRYGLRSSRHQKKIEPLLEQLILESNVLDIDLETSDVYARVRKQLRTDGHPIPENDLWIAALSLQHNLPVVSRDMDFRFVAGLQHVRW